MMLRFSVFLLWVLWVSKTVNGFLLKTATISSARTTCAPTAPLGARQSEKSGRNQVDKRRMDQHFMQDNRREFGNKLGLIGAAGILTSLLMPNSVIAAPPIAVIAEELGYFPVTNAERETVYVPKRIKRESTQQAISLARKLRESGAVTYTAFWCPHCARQRELWGREAWKELRNVECAPKGYNAQPGICLAKQVDGYPTTILGNGKRISGERSLADIAKEVGFRGFQDDLETNLPPPLGSSACR